MIQRVDRTTYTCKSDSFSSWNV